MWRRGSRWSLIDNDSIVTQEDGRERFAARVPTHAMELHEWAPGFSPSARALAELEGGGDQLHHELLLEAAGGGAGVAFGVERAEVLAGPGETPAVAGDVDVGLFGAGARHLLGCFQCLTHSLLVPFPLFGSRLCATRLDPPINLSIYRILDYPASGLWGRISSRRLTRWLHVGLIAAATLRPIEG
jgi:hypothetical protein